MNKTLQTVTVMSNKHNDEPMIVSSTVKLGARICERLSGLLCIPLIYGFNQN